MVFMKRFKYNIIIYFFGCVFPLCHRGHCAAHARYLSKAANMVVKKQRGKRASTLKAAVGETPMEDFSLALESSDDEAPEEVTFEDSKTQALRSMKQALDTARR